MIHARTSVAALAATAGFLFTGSALADPETHDGFFLRMGVNLGPAIVTETIEGGGFSAESDISGFQIGEEILLGGSPIPGLVIGGGLLFGHVANPTISAGGQDIETDGTMLFFAPTAFVNYYIDPQSGLNLQGMFGYGLLDFVSAEGQSGGNDPGGIMFGVGVGYDFWLSDEWSVGPFGRFVYGALGADGGGGVSSSVSYINPSIGAVFTLH